MSAVGETPLNIHRRMAWDDFVEALRVHGFEIVQRHDTECVGINEGWMNHRIIAAHRAKRMLVLGHGGGRLGEDKLSDADLYFAVPIDPRWSNTEYRRVFGLMGKTSDSTPVKDGAGEVVKRVEHHNLSTCPERVADLLEYVKENFGTTVPWSWEQPHIYTLASYFGEEIEHGPGWDAQNKAALRRLPEWVQSFMSP